MTGTEKYMDIKHCITYEKLTPKAKSKKSKGNKDEEIDNRQIECFAKKNWESRVC